MKQLPNLQSNQRLWHDWDSKARSFRPRARKDRWRFGIAELRVMTLAGVLAGLVWTQLPVIERLDSPPQPWARVRDALPPTVRAEASARRRFTLCHTGGGFDCVVDGDTFRMDGVRIRIADIDTPETHGPRCDAEAERGTRATRRLRQLLNAGPVALTRIDRDADRYGRKLRLVSVDGRGVGETLVSEGLARPYRGGPRHGWCDA